MANRRALACAVLVALLLLCSPLSAQKALLLPSGTKTTASFFKSDPLTSQGTITVGAGAFAAFNNPTASLYFIVSSTNITTVDGNGQAVSGSPTALARPAVAAAMTPDGSKLLVLTGSSTTSALLYVFNVAGGLPNLAGSIAFDDSPLDVLGSMDSRLAYVLTTSGMTTVDLTSTSFPKGDTLFLAGLAAPRSGVAQGPNGLLYINAADALYEIDVPALTLRKTFAITGFVTKPTFTPDNKALLANPAAGSGEPALLVIDLNTYTTLTKDSSGHVFQKLLWLGTDKYYALSSTPRMLYEIDGGLTSLQRAAFANTEVPSDIVDAFITDELPQVIGGSGGPDFLFLVTVNSVYRYNLKTGSNSPDVVISTLNHSLTGVRGGAYLAPVSTRSTSGALFYGDDQQVAPGANPLPLVIRTVDSEGRPTPGVGVNFGASDTLARMSTTNNLGFAMAVPRTPAAGESIIVSSVITGVRNFRFHVSGKTDNGGGDGGDGTVEFTGISIVNGNGQALLGSSRVYEPTILLVTNSAGTPQAGVTVHLSLAGGPGVGSTANTCTAQASDLIDCTTDANGRVTLDLTTPVLMFDLSVPYIQATITASISAANVDQQSVTLYLTAFPQFTYGGQAQGVVQGQTFIAPGAEGTIEVEAGKTLAGAIQVRTFTRSALTSGRVIPNIGLNIRRTMNYCTSDAQSDECTAIKDEPLVARCAAPAGTVLTNADGVATCDVAVPAGTAGGLYNMYAIVAGNSALHFFLRVTKAAPVVPVLSSVEIASGDGQTGPVNSTLPQPLVGIARDQLSRAMSGQAVTWQVMSGSATLTNTSTTTNASGEASATVKFGATPGLVEVKLTAGSFSATFTVTSTASADHLNKISGDNQSVAMNQVFDPVVVQVLDTSDDPLPGIPVSFNVTGGVATPTSTTVNTGTDGKASATFTAGSTWGPVTIAVTAAGKTQTFTLTVRRPGPELSGNSFMNAASFVPGVAFGGMVAIKGAGLTYGLTLAAGDCLTGLPDGIYERGLPTRVGGVEVLFGGTNAPIFAVCKGTDGFDQVNIQAPMALFANPNSSVVVRTAAGTDAQLDTTVTGVNIKASQPGVFEYPVNSVKYAIAFRPDGSLVSPTNPAQHGEKITLYVTGLGLVKGLVPTNQTGSGQESYYQVRVYINGANPSDAIATYAPGKIGMFNVSFTVPDSAPVGANIPLSVWSFGDGLVEASQNVRIAIQ